MASRAAGGRSRCTWRGSRGATCRWPGADAIEWGSRRLDIFILGRFFLPEIRGHLLGGPAGRVAAAEAQDQLRPDPGAVITQNLEEGNRRAVAQQVRQVGFWIIAAQLGIALALAIPGEAVMGLMGPSFVAGTGALAFLLAAEAIAATAAVSEAALIYVARYRNLLISIAMIIVQTILSVVLIYAIRDALPWLAQFGLAPRMGDPRTDPVSAAGVSIALMLALGMSSIVKARLLRGLLGARVSGWRWAVVPAIGLALVVGGGVLLLPNGRSYRSASRQSSAPMGSSSGIAASARRIACCSRCAPARPRVRQPGNTRRAVPGSALPFRGSAQYSAGDSTRTMTRPVWRKKNCSRCAGR
jgi:hypothetical protein